MSYRRLIEFSETKQSWIRAYYWIVVCGIACVVISALLGETAALAVIIAMILGAVIVVPIWLLPLYLIWTATSLREGERLMWIIAGLFISWIAWILYLLFAPLDPAARVKTED